MPFRFLMLSAIFLCSLSTAKAEKFLNPFFDREGGFTTSIPWLEKQYEKLSAIHGPPKGLPLRRNRRAVEIGENETFWAMNVEQNSPVQVEAKLRHVGDHCYIYLELEEEDHVSQETLEELARRFDEEIYPTNHKFFGSENSPGVDYDERITLLFLDIQDGWEPGKGYVAGYFSPMDQFSTNVWEYSNEREIFYMDIYPADATRQDYLGVLAHEFQHMIHFNYDQKEELFLNEALSQISFWVNDFGHAPQILSFIRQPDTQVNEFNNGIDDYGNVYLFMYYIATKVLNSDRELIARVFSEIVQNEENGLPTIQSALESAGVSQSLESIMQNFLLANFINDETLKGGQYGYDSTLPIKVQPTHVSEFSKSHALQIEGRVQENAADFIHFSDKVLSSPTNATLVDTIRIFAEAPGTIRWNLNDGTLPPKAWRPKGSRIESDFVVTPTKSEDGAHFIEVGPFTGQGLQVTRINFEAHSELSVTAGQIPVYSFQTRSQKPEAFRLDFDGENKGWFGQNRSFTLHLYKELDNGAKSLETIELNKQNDASITVSLEGLKALTLIPISTHGGELEYTVSVQDANHAPSGILGDWLKNEDAFLSRLISEPELMQTFSSEWKTLDPKMKRMHGLRMRTFMRRYQFEVMNQNPKMRPAAEALQTLQNIPLNPQDADSDTSHDNLEFLIAKAREGEHALSHLKIDPKFLEGQILQMYKLLQVSQGLPNLPLPDGFAFVDYDTTSVNKAIDHFEAQGNQDDFETLRRLTIAEDIVLTTYNEGLTLAEEASLSLLDLTSFFMQSKSTVSKLLNPLIQNGGLTGRLAKGLKKRIHAKIVQILSRVVALVSARLPSPYNTVVPIASTVIQYIYTRIFDLSLESDQKWMKPFVAKTLGKYALMSVPKIGIIAQGNPNVDYVSAKALDVSVSGTTEDAHEAVRQQLHPLMEEVATIHSRSVKEREYAQIAKYVSQLSSMTSVLDPTILSKVIGIVSTVTGTGLLVHSIWESTSGLYGIPGQVPDMVDEAYRPFGGSTVENPGLLVDGFDSLSRTRINLSENRERLQRAHSAYLQVVEDALNAQNIVIIKELAQAEEAYAKAMSLEELALLGHSGQRASKTLLSMSQAALKRSQLEADLLNQNYTTARSRAREVLRTERELFKRIQSLETELSIVPVIGAKLIELRENDDEFVATVELEKLGYSGDVNVRIMAPAHIELMQTTMPVQPHQKRIQIRGKRSKHIRNSTLNLSLEAGPGVVQMPLIVNLDF